MRGCNKQEKERVREDSMRRRKRKNARGKLGEQ